MKKYLFLLFLFFPVWANGATYHVSTTAGAGVDYTIIAQVNATTFLAGDTVAFKCGDTFTDARLNFPSSGTTNAPITITSYGIGAKPIFTKGVLFDLGRDNIIISNLEIWASGSHALSIQGGDNYIIENCLLDGKNLGSSLNCFQGSRYITTQKRLTNVIIRNCIAQNGVAGINFAAGCNDILIENCKVINCTEVGIECYSSTVGVYTYNCIISKNIIQAPQTNGDSYRGILVGEFSYNHIIDNNLVTNLFPNTSIYNHYYGIVVDPGVHDVIISNNIVYDAYHMIAILLGSSTYGNTDNIKIYNNTCIANSNSDTTGTVRGITGSNYATPGQQFGTNIDVKNNIVYMIGSSRRLIDFGSDFTLVTSDYNCFYNTTTFYARWTNGVSYSSLASWQAATGQDSHSITSNPLLTSNYRLFAGSPCINAGVDVDVVKDKNGMLRTGSPDLGAYERINGGGMLSK